MAYNFVPLPLRRIAKKASAQYETFKFAIEIKWAYRSDFSFDLPALPRPSFSRNQIIGASAIALIILILAFFPFGSGSTEEKNLNSLSPSAANTEMTPDSIKAPPPPSMKVVIAGKKEKKLMVGEWFANSKFQQLAEFPIAIGEKEGRKERQGDLKTPEGLYWIIDRMEDEDLPNLYGVRAFVLNYPNAQDRKEKRSGNGIWIHGDETENQPDKTRGCLGLSNANLEILTPYLYIGMPVLILPSLEEAENQIVNSLEWKQLTASKKKILSTTKSRDAFVKAFLERWRAAWEAKDIETYALFYSKKFTQNGMNYETWKEYKKSLFQKPEQLNIEITDITLSKLTNTFAMITFTQSYSSGEYKSIEKKIMKLVKTGKEWRITEESIIPGRTS
ncbi:MAG: L,D-transpeptidase family protein [Fibrobacteres bacterium]|nr:L,D-transpeptidase family protein [Fibrobacterota bacterium]